MKMKRPMRGLLAASWLMLAMPVGAAQWPLEILDAVGDKRIVLFLTETDIATSPEWSPDDGGPLLTLAAVINRLDDWVDSSLRLTGLQIEEIRLKPIQHPDVGRRWYYLVKLYRQVNGRPDRHYVAVLMNGSVVPALRDPLAASDH